MMNAVSLAGEWTLCWTGHEIPARVPGNFELDLQRAGLIDDPYVADNALQVADYESCRFILKRSFSGRGLWDRTRLILDGVDCYAEVWLNGIRIGMCDNAFYPHRFEVTAALRAEGNDLELRFTPAKLHHRSQLPEACYFSSFRDNFDATRSRRPCHVSGWDIAPRLPLGGIYYGVELQEIPFAEWETTLLQTTPEVSEEEAHLLLTLSFRTGDDDLRNYRAEVDGVCGESEFHWQRGLGNFSSAFRLVCKRPKLWFPAGYGDANLYTVTFKLYRGDELLAFQTRQFGIRYVELVRHAGVASGSAGTPEMFFRINHRAVKLCGTNWVAVDALHSRDGERMKDLLALLPDLHCNAVRVWGGSLYETEEFYDFCDRCGIMVWQDLMMACAVYPHDPEFLASLEREMLHVIPRLRHHACIIVWCGDNECDLVPEWSTLCWNPDENIITRRLLPEILHRLDPLRPFIPSSPWVDNAAYREARRQHHSCDKRLPENHLWGPRNYFKSSFYACNPASMVTEIGYHGAPAVESIRAFIPEGFREYAPDNHYWLYHASNPFIATDDELNYRIEIMARQIDEMFGFVPRALEEFVAASQICQAEADKYFIELFRVDPARSGLLWWNLADCWPQFSDAVIDYYNVKKLAYYYIRRSQAPVCGILTEPAGWTQKLLMCNDSAHPVRGRGRLRSFDRNELLFDGEFELASHQNREMGEFRLRSSSELRIIEWEMDDRRTGINHFLTGTPPFDLCRYREEFLPALRLPEL